MKAVYFILMLTIASCDILEGIDVSAWQGVIDWTKVITQKKFAIIRAGYGQGNKDTYYDANYEGAKEAGMPIGIYWYSYADSGEAAANEAYHCINLLKGRQFEYPIYIDIEEKSIFEAGIANDVAINFCTVMEENKYFCGIYSSLYTFNTYFSEEVKKRYSIWLAQWNTQPTYDGDFGIWQYGLSPGGVSGISGDCDGDKGYIDFPTIIKKAHLNGY